MSTPSIKPSMSLRRTTSTSSTGTAQSLRRTMSNSSALSAKSQIPRSVPTLPKTLPKTLPMSSPIHVAPEEPAPVSTSSPSLTFNPFEGRLFGSVSPVLGRESHEFLDQSPFSSPKPNQGRGSRTGPFIFSDLELDHSDSDDGFGGSKVSQMSPRKSKYTNVDLDE